MSLVSYEDLNPEQLISQYVLECRGKGNMIALNDHYIISEWLKAAPSSDKLLLVLADILPEYFAKRADKSQPPSLKGLQKKVLKKLKDAAMQGADLR